ncbi:AP2 domain protein [compost metagenome]
MAANNTSGHKGVTWNKHAKKWMALIKVGGRSKTLGYRDDIESAADLYKQAAEKYHGEFART